MASVIIKRVLMGKNRSAMMIVGAIEIIKTAPLGEDRNALTIERAIVVIGAVPMIVARADLESVMSIRSIVAIGIALPTEAAITGTTSTRINNMNTKVIGAHGQIGTGMPESIPRCLNRGTITVKTPI